MAVDDVIKQRRTNEKADIVVPFHFLSFWFDSTLIGFGSPNQVTELFFTGFFMKWYPGSSDWLSMTSLNKDEPMKRQTTLFLDDFIGFYRVFLNVTSFSSCPHFFRVSLNGTLFQELRVLIKIMLYTCFDLFFGLSLVLLGLPSFIVLSIFCSF